jgi:hypothetical protein
MTLGPGRTFRFVAVRVLVAGFLGSSSATALVAQQARDSTSHLQVVYPADERAAARAFLGYAEGVYEYIDTLFGGALPEKLHVTLLKDARSGSSGPELHLSLHHRAALQAVYAAELSRVAEREILGESYELQGYRFVTEGLANWVEARYERQLGIEKSRDIWAAYAYVLEATYPEYLASYELAEEELGKNVVDAVGYSFVSHVFQLHGMEGVRSLLDAMAVNVDVCSSLSDSGADCEEFVDGWQSALAEQARRYDFASLPEIWSLIEVSGQGDLREVGLRVYIQNPESSEFTFFVSYVIDGEHFEEAFPAERSEFRAIVPLGTMREGTKLLWEVSVWSSTVLAWRKSGWQDQVIR